ncbi:vitamin B12 transporter [Pseudomonas taetrolens]|uniref:TonB-dependent receptor n=1 Tax=Pseudomonas taetrolens TaxID=47884 RepID=A0A0J6GY26_PSETA|nr:TonB-dependent receptor [Pseudomonas taetrolens]KMM87029.1 TonB-dependent receptor [Pseudomonas taetrolens]SEB56699.1 vitamin B12 transporter [Pseudomonas taetrolens]SQF84857.1 B12 family TonB-dependent receptor [Pseudomonas taetrolens]VEH46625.1 B12 family TonB-dependent receptor [Pseudomonas taetrolens]
MKVLRFALLLGIVPASPLLAADTSPEREDALKLPQTLISGNRQVQARSDSSSASSVFTRDDIDRLQPTSLTDLLGRIPGVQIARSGGRGGLPGIYIRGTKSAQSLVLVDGQRMANATSADSNLQYLNIDQIERVEVLRGSRSVIYGSDAIGGVIQVFTRRGADHAPQLRLRSAVGSYGSSQNSVGISGGDELTRFNLSTSLEETAGVNRTYESFPSDSDHDAYRNKSLSLNLSHTLSDDIEIGLSALKNTGKTELDNGFGRWDPETSSVSGQQLYSDFDISSVSSFIDAQLTERWNSRLELGHSENREKTRDKLSPEIASFNTYRDSLNWQNNLTLTDQHSLIVGADAYEDRVRSSTVFNQDSRWNRAAFIQHRFQGDHFSTELGLRHDQNQQFGSQNTWSASLTVPLNADNDVLLSYSEGFRAPTFNDLYYPQFGNAALKPEHSKSYELQWRSQLSEDSRLETSLYRTDIRDAIVADADFIQQNIGAARVTGFESALHQQWFGWQSSLGIAIIDPRDRESGHTLGRRARRTLSLDLDRQFDRLGVGASWQAVSSSFNDEDNTQPIAGYGLLGLRGNWQASPQVRLDLKVDNLLDKTFTRALYSFDGSYYGYREERRSVQLAVTWTPTL